MPHHLNDANPDEVISMQKIISKSQAKELSLKKYFTGIPCKNGHTSDRYVSSGGCITCQNANGDAHKERCKLYYKQNKEKMNSKAKLWRENNKERHKERCKDYYINNKEAIKLRKSEYCMANREKIIKWNSEYRALNVEKTREWNRNSYYNSKERDLEAFRERNKVKAKRFREDNPEHYKVRQFMNRSVRRIFDFCGHPKNNLSCEVLGYSPNDLAERLASLFAEGMSWDNYGDWQIDHVKPVSVFFKEGVTDPAIINALDNLQPMWEKENKSKGAKYEPI